MPLYEEPSSLQEPLLQTLEEKRRDLFVHIQQTGELDEDYRKKLKVLADAYQRKYDHLKTTTEQAAKISACSDELVLRRVAHMLASLADDNIGYHYHKVLDMPVEVKSDGKYFSQHAEKRWMTDPETAFNLELGSFLRKTLMVPGPVIKEVYARALHYPDVIVAH